jgi:enamine deaminase RidA (YjgF/YER057c/UK114 family)
MADLKKKINPSTIRAPFSAYSHGIVVPPNARWLLASGQLGVADMTFDDVVRFCAFVTDRSAFPIYGRVRGRYVTAGNFASTLVIVGGFTRPEFKIEVEVTAARAADR